MELFIQNMLVSKLISSNYINWYLFFLTEIMVAHLVANMYGLPSKNVRIKTVDLIFSHIGFGRDIKRLCQNTHKLFLSYTG